MSTALSIETRLIDGEILVVVLDGTLNITTADRFNQAIQDQLDQQRTMIIVDCRNIEYISSVGLGALVALQARLRKKGGRSEAGRRPGRDGRSNPHRGAGPGAQHLRRPGSGPASGLMLPSRQRNNRAGQLSPTAQRRFTRIVLTQSRKERRGRRAAAERSKQVRIAESGLDAKQLLSVQFGMTVAANSGWRGRTAILARAMGGPRANRSLRRSGANRELNAANGR